ncbi:hypothetical protein ACFS5L_33200 [Streptomyces phyllanthi]|uniref:Uncharacterized protein n=1 Tax=Streptomyces phyllanthi TaxID=1803180 RepID=A0A5N8WB08_9ACTN|nr:hypothetical protein [Streptomyces phyllanthi]MPY44650.1 hypothetical protein [Streptomyces phyllanthi]
MNSIEFLHYPRPEGAGDLLWGFRIDGADLRVHAAHATRALWRRECEVESPEEEGRFLRAQHDGLGTDEVGDPVRHFLGDPAPEFAGSVRGAVPVLGCSCGLWGCWPLRTLITVTPAAVTWSSFRQPYREQWGELPMGPYVFTRTLYEAALAEPVLLAEDPLGPAILPE